MTPTASPCVKPCSHRTSPSPSLGRGSPDSDDVDLGTALMGWSGLLTLCVTVAVLACGGALLAVLLLREMVR